MLIFLLFALLVAIVAIVFAVQNNQPVTISFLFWETEGSLALVLLIAIIAGVLICYLASLPSNIKTRLTIRNIRKQIQKRNFLNESFLILQLAFILIVLCKGFIVKLKILPL